MSTKEKRLQQRLEAKANCLMEKIEDWAIVQKSSNLDRI